LPADWTPTPEHHERAAAARLNVDHEADKFRAHAASNGRTAVCWNAAFTTWLLKAVEFGAQRRGVARAPTNTTGPIQPDRNGTPVFGDKHGFKSPSPSPASA
jgi:hypothetical protein